MPLAGQKCLTKMVLYFSGFVIIVNRMLNGHLEIQNFFSSFENISLVCCADTLAIFFNSRREISYLCTAMQYPLRIKTRSTPASFSPVTVKWA